MSVGFTNIMKAIVYVQQFKPESRKHIYNFTTSNRL